MSVAAVGTLRPGTDPSYPWRHIGTSAGVDPAPAGDPLDYFLSPAEAGGEPPGTWTGRGLGNLGLAEGQVINQDMFVKLFGEHLDPRDPSGKTRLGRAPQAFGWKPIYRRLLAEDPEASRETLKEQAKQEARQHPAWEAKYDELLAAEPHAAPARQAELKALAQADTRQARPYWEYTFSVSKSISVLYGGYLAAARQAREAGQTIRAVEMEHRAAIVWKAIVAGNATALAYLQREAGITRTGHHGGTGAEDGREAGWFEDANDWIIGSFRHHTSRAGDPQLHVHNLILNKVLVAGGKWLKLDSTTMYRHFHAATELGNADMEGILAGELGSGWVPRADGHGREIAGISQDLMDRNSGRTREQIEPLARQIAAQREEETGRPPTAWQMSRIRQDATLRTRPAKTPYDPVASLRHWETTARDSDMHDLAAVPGAMAAAGPGAGQDGVERVARAVSLVFTREHGRAPDQAEYARMLRFANFVTLRGTDSRPVDPELLHRAWQAQEHADAQTQELLRRDIARAQARSGPPPAPAQEQVRVRGYAAPAEPALTAEQTQRVMAEAVASLSAKHPTWTKADLITRLGEVLPARHGAVLEDLATRALAGESGERVELLSAPEWPRIPDTLRRANGESKLSLRGAERYASSAQLGLEARLLSRAQAPGAPHLHGGTAALMLGTSTEQISAALRAEPTAAQLSQTTGSGLRMDQAAAAWHVLTSPRRAELMVGPAGTGKTRTATELARIWSQAGLGSTVALTTSSNARNVIRGEATAQGVELAAYNTAEWLGHTKTAREARQPISLAAGSLVIVDEGSVTSLPDLDAIARRVTETGGKLVVTGDPVQMQAPEGGGGMAFLAKRLGHVQLTETWRFTHPWEREATTRLRDGDVTVLAGYTQHDRLHDGPAEQVLEDAAHAYLHDHLSGKDTLLMAATDAMAGELARRVREDLIHWGHVDPGPTVGLRNGYHASRGDRIMARQNEKITVKTDQPSRGILNRDVLRITDIDPDGAGQRVLAERLTGRDPATGVEQWSASFKVPRIYLERHAQLAYAVNFHTAEGRTVDSGLAVFTGQEDRQAVNTAMTRGRGNNEAFVITGWNIADPDHGAEADPELARHDQQASERDGLRDQAAVDLDDDDPGQQTAAGILAACLRRDGQVRAATDVREAEWSDADRLDVLDTPWQHLTRLASQHRYQTALSATLGEEQAGRVAEEPAAKWVWQALREAEAAGLDGPDVLRRAVESSSLADAGSVAKVLHWRISQQTARMPAQAGRPFTEQVPHTGDPEMDRYASELAEAMTDRQRRLGEHASEHPPTWAAVLGPVPAEPAGRADWEHTAGLIGRYRERWGHTHLTDPIGPRPDSPHNPDAQADWHAAAHALGYQPGDLHEHSDGQLWAWRSAFAREMAWAPANKAEDLALVRGGIRHAQIEADRARRNADAATTPEARQRLAERAEAAARWEQMTHEVAAQLTEAQAGYDAWEHTVRPTLDRAIAADAALRRRHPGEVVEPLRATSTPAAGFTRPGKPARHDSEREHGPVEPRNPEVATAGPQQAAAERETDGQEEPEAGRMAEVRRQIEEVQARLTEAEMHRARQAQEKAAEVTSASVPGADPDMVPSVGWLDDLQARQRQAVQHDPLPRVPASPAIPVREAAISAPEAAD